MPENQQAVQDPHVSFLVHSCNYVVSENPLFVKIEHSQETSLFKGSIEEGSSITLSNQDLHIMEGCRGRGVV